MADYDLPPPPHVRIWTGKVFNVSTRYSSAGLSTTLFLDTSEGRMILDCGDGCVRDSIEIERHMRENGHLLPRRDLKQAGEAILGAVISHPHYDHYSGLLTLLNFLQLLGREAPFPIIYPEGGHPVEAMVDHFTDHLWEGPLFDIDLVPMTPGGRMALGGVEIYCISSEHRHSRPGKVGGPVCALAYRFSKDGETVVYTGDTGDISPIKELARDSDLVIIEATFPEPGPDSRGVHLTLDQAMELSKVARDHMLVHFTAWSFEKAVREKFIRHW
ncbi:MAG: MBL fold metallo-hydrolase [Thermoplasmatota archaeon]